MPDGKLPLVHSVSYGNDEASEKLQVTSYTLHVTRYKLKVTSYKV